MDWNTAGQIVNIWACLAAFAVANYRFFTLAKPPGKLYPFAHAVNCIALMWYAIINAIQVFDLFNMSTLAVVPYFRWAFSILLASYALRQYAMARGVVKL